VDDEWFLFLADVEREQVGLDEAARTSVYGIFKTSQFTHSAKGQLDGSIAILPALEAPVFMLRN
jgi:hypothetical protein